ncbi:MAG: Modification methylase DpnIIB [Parcubacteria bacterium OLB19]|nr:MAG: Modification methylase DpnIIB [Parcubacteria bacterium OLB19]
MKKLIWRTEVRTVDELTPQAINPRTISDKQMSDIKKSLTKYNLVEIPAIDTNGTILAGHQRIKALQLLGRGQEKIDVRVPNRKLTKQETDQYLIASNKLGGEWDFEALKSFDIDLLTDAGFDSVELAEFWDTDKHVDADDFDEEKELEEIKTTDIKRGDLLILGKHKILCGDSTDSKAVQVLFNGEKTSMIYSDPPYNINLDYNKGVGNKANYGGNVQDNKSPEDYKDFIRKTLEAGLSVSTPNVHIFYWCDEAWTWIFQTLYNELGIKNRRLNIWLKNNASPTPTVAFNKAIEFCVYGTKGSPYLAKKMSNCTEIMNAEVAVGNDLVDTVSNIWATKRIKISEYEHPTSKPPSLHEKAIKRCTKPNDIILDSFSGSASTLVCGESLNRRVYSLEAEPIFCELARRRYEKLTGQKVVLIKNYYEKD